MQTPQRKPRVFVSHSKKDIDFIRRLDSDLRGCLCDTWIDEIEIRHGRPWLDEIFAAGIPSCEVVLCYVTANSVQSQMVQREIDARLIERFANDRVALLLYAESESVRSMLRVDLKSLQVPVLNSDTYGQVFPRIVAEIWRSFSEFAMSQAVQGERVRRLELELQLARLESEQSASVFLPAEDAEFRTIWAQIDRVFVSDVRVSENRTKVVIIKATCSVSYGQLFVQSICSQRFKPSRYDLQSKIAVEVLAKANVRAELPECSATIPFDYESELLKFGFLRRAPRQVLPNENPMMDRFQQRFEMVLTEKFDRFRFWLEHESSGVSLSTGIIVKFEIHDSSSAD